MGRRDALALILGVVFWYLVWRGGVGAGAMLLTAFVLCPLVTAAVADKRIFLAALVPDLVLAGTALIFGPSSLSRLDTFEFLYDTLGLIVMGVWLAPLAAGAV